MSVVAAESLFTLHHHHHHHHQSRRSSCFKPVEKFQLVSKASVSFKQNCTQTPNLRADAISRRYCPPKAVSSPAAAAVETLEASDVAFSETFDLKRREKLEGKITIRLESGGDEENWTLTVGCSLPGKWALHWGVNYIGDTGSEWDQPPEDMRPPGSVPIKGYAVKTPLERSTNTSEGDSSSEVKIDFNTSSSITAINFVLKDEETGRWYRHGGRDFEVYLIDCLQDDGSVVGALEQVSDLPVKTESSDRETHVSNLKKRCLQDFYEEHFISKELCTNNLMNVSVRHNTEKAKNELYIDTDLPGHVVVHWGVCRDEGKNWEVPEEPYPPETIPFKNKALQTWLQPKSDGGGSWGSFTLADEFSAFVFVLKLDDNTWLNCKGDDFYIPFSTNTVKNELSASPVTSADTTDPKQVVGTYTVGIINEINKLVTGISTEKSRKTQSRKGQEVILQEIEKLAAEAYSIFRKSTPIFTEIDVSEDEDIPPPVIMSSGTGSGFEIVCQGFNWESHKTGRWYLELQEQVSTLASLGFTVIWLPPPTDSVSPEGYMPRDLYNLNSRYGNMEQLKNLVDKLHEVGIKALGDAVLNHRCAEFQNENGVWNKFGGRLNWDSRAIVSDDPHFQGSGNKSSGDSFHAAPNIDHSQEFVRNDIKEWLCWLRKEVGYDGWRFDFVRGFWGGYVKDYLEASEPYFVVGEFWDSLCGRVKVTKKRTELKLR